MCYYIYGGFTTSAACARSQESECIEPKGSIHWPMCHNTDTLTVYRFKTRHIWTSKCCKKMTYSGNRDDQPGMKPGSLVNHSSTINKKITKEIISWRLQRPESQSRNALVRRSFQTRWLIVTFSITNPSSYPYSTPPPPSRHKQAHLIGPSALNSSCRTLATAASLFELPALECRTEWKL